MVADFAVVSSGTVTIKCVDTRQVVLEQERYVLSNLKVATANVGTQAGVQVWVRPASSTED